MLITTWLRSNHRLKNHEWTDSFECWGNGFQNPKEQEKDGVRAKSDQLTTVSSSPHGEDGTTI